jgi:multicomponent Na+:H+ antiporter subunit F
VNIFIGTLILCMFMCLYRVGKGPTAPDRIVPIDIMGILMVGFCALYSIITKKDLYMNIGISWALLNFIGTLALAKYLEGRGFDE